METDDIDNLNNEITYLYQTINGLRSDSIYSFHSNLIDLFENLSSTLQKVVDKLDELQTKLIELENRQEKLEAIQ